MRRHSDTLHGKKGAFRPSHETPCAPMRQLARRLQRDGGSQPGPLSDGPGKPPLPSLHLKYLISCVAASAEVYSCLASPPLARETWLSGTAPVMDAQRGTGLKAPCPRSSLAPPRHTGPCRWETAAPSPRQLLIGVFIALWPSCTARGRRWCDTWVLRGQAGPPPWYAITAAVPHRNAE